LLRSWPGSKLDADNIKGGRRVAFDLAQELTRYAGKDALLFRVDGCFGGFSSRVCAS